MQIKCLTTLILIKYIFIIIAIYFLFNIVMEDLKTRKSSYEGQFCQKSDFTKANNKAANNMH